MKYRPFWCNIDHKIKNIDHIDQNGEYRPMVNYIDPVAALPLYIYWEVLKRQCANRVAPQGQVCSVYFRVVGTCSTGQLTGDHRGRNPERESGHTAALRNQTHAPGWPSVVFTHWRELWRHGGGAVEKFFLEPLWFSFWLHLDIISSSTL